MIRVALEDVGRAEIDALVENETIEDRTLEYKEYLPTDTPSKKSLLKAVTALANSDGGDLVIGLQEERLAHRKTARAKEAVGVEVDTFEETRQALQALIRDGTDPPVRQVHFREVPGFERGPVIVVRVERSLLAPHMVCLGQDNRFYARAAASTYTMGATELRRAFGLSEALGVRLRELRDERLDLLESGLGSLLMQDGAKLAMLLVPLSALVLSPPLDLGQIEPLGWSSRLRPFSALSATFRYNIDGVLVTGGPTADKRCRAYAQLFTDGRLEIVDMDVFSDAAPQIGRPNPLIEGGRLEGGLVEQLSRLLETEAALQVRPPLFVLVSLVGVLGHGMAPREGRFSAPTTIDRDRILLPDVAIEDYGADLPTVLRPVFDAVSRATGLPGSQYYGRDGAWELRRDE